MSTYRPVRARLEDARSRGMALDDRLCQAVRKDFPQLCGWLLPSPRREPKSAARAAAAWERWIVEAPPFAAGRISEAYGMGAGSGFLARHGLLPAPQCETRATAQALASLSAVGAMA
jgi:hypothetical protein